MKNTNNFNTVLSTIRKNARNTFVAWYDYFEHGDTVEQAKLLTCDSETDTYFTDLYKWLCADIDNAEYLENAIEEMGTSENFCLESALRLAQSQQNDDLLNGLNLIDLYLQINYNSDEMEFIKSELENVEYLEVTASDIQDILDNEELIKYVNSKL